MSVGTQFSTTAHSCICSLLYPNVRIESVLHQLRCFDCGQFFSLSPFSRIRAEHDKVPFVLSVSLQARQRSANPFGRCMTRGNSEWVDSYLFGRVYVCSVQVGVHRRQIVLCVAVWRVCDGVHGMQWKCVLPNSFRTATICLVCWDGVDRSVCVCIQISWLSWLVFHVEIVLRAVLPLTLLAFDHCLDWSLTDMARWWSMKMAPGHWRFQNCRGAHSRNRFDQIAAQFCCYVGNQIQWLRSHSKTIK